VPFFQEIFFGLYEQMVRKTDKENPCAINERKCFGGKSWWWSISEIYQTFPKILGKDTKSLSSDMMVSWSKFQPGTPEYKQEASELQSNFSTCNFSTQLKKVMVLKGQ
jgi:hypothetical protein